MIIILGVGELGGIKSYLMEFETKLNKIKKGLSKFSTSLSTFDYGHEDDGFEIILFTDPYLTTAKSTLSYIDWFNSRYKNDIIIHVTNSPVTHAGIKGEKWLFNLPKKPIVFMPPPVHEDMDARVNEDDADDYEPDEEDDNEDN